MPPLPTPPTPSTPPAAHHAAEHPPSSTRFLDAAPALTRPLALLDGRAYAVAQPLAQTTTTQHWDAAAQAYQPLPQPQVHTRPETLVLRDDGHTYGFQGAEPLTALPFELRLPLRLPPDQQWSPAALAAFQAGHRPAPAQVFACLSDLFDHFIDFDSSLGPQRRMADLFALAVLATWLTPGLPQPPSLWLLGEQPGVASPALSLLAQLSYLGLSLSGPQPRAALRDLIDCGATLAFDDADTLPTLDPSGLGLTPARRGVTLTLKEKDPHTRAWQLRRLNLACPRFYAAVNPPPARLAAGSLVIPLVRSGDPARAQRDPLDLDSWPHPPLALHADLWALALAHLPALPHHAAQAARAAQLPPAALAPWHPLLAVAHWLSHGPSYLPDLFAQVTTLAHTAQAEQPALAGDDFTTFILRAIIARYTRYTGSTTSTGSTGLKMSADPGGYHLSTADVITAAIFELTPDSPIVRADLTPQRVGRLLARLRLTPGRRANAAGQNARHWTLTRRHLERWSRAYDLPLPD